MNILTWLGLLNLLLLAMCIAMFFMPNGLQIHVDNFDLNITPFGLFVFYAIFNIIIIFTNLYCIVLLKLNRNKRRAKLDQFLNEFSRLKKLNKNAKPNDNSKDVAINMPIPIKNKTQVPEEIKPLINSDSGYESSEPSIVDTIQDADYEQLRLMFTK
jgi:hypothetical protein